MKNLNIKKHKGFIKMKLLRYGVITLIIPYVMGSYAGDNFIIPYTNKPCANTQCHFNPAHGTKINLLICPPTYNWVDLDNIDQFIFGSQRLAYSYQVITNKPDINEYVMHVSYEAKRNGALAFFNLKKENLLKSMELTPKQDIATLLPATAVNRLNAYIQLISQRTIRYEHRPCPGAIVPKRAIMCIMQWISLEITRM